jgi:hypothetical protein
VPGCRLRSTPWESKAWANLYCFPQVRQGSCCQSP